MTKSEVPNVIFTPIFSRKTSCSGEKSSLEDFRVWKSSRLCHRKNLFPYFPSISGRHNLQSLSILVYHPWDELLDC